MVADLDPLDVEELRRRVIDPVVNSLVRTDELEEIEVSVGAHPGSLGVVVVRVRARGEWISGGAAWTVMGDDRLWDARIFADELYDYLRDELAESRLSWGQWRDGEYEVLGPRHS